MNNKKKIIAIIPARSGSKGLKNKNIKKFDKKPLIYWTINSALKSKYIDKCFVSTDSKKISDISNKFGADTSFLRPSILSSDKSEISSTIIHVLKNIKENFDIIILLQPTSPLRDNNDIDKALRIFIRKNLTSLVSISSCDYPYEWILKKNKLNEVNFVNNNKSKNRQQAKSYFQANGAIYISTTKNYLRNKTFFNNKTYGFLMNKSKSIDIDDIIDFKIAEIIKKSNE